LEESVNRGGIERHLHVVHTGEEAASGHDLTGSGEVGGNVNARVLGT
jgi:hypothetical protein